MNSRVQIGRLSVAPVLHRFIEEEALAGTGIDSTTFWSAAEEIIHDLAPRNRALLAQRAEIQSAVDEYHRAHPGPITDGAAYKSFLRDIGYLVDEPADFQIDPGEVDTEIAEQSGPQLVVPLLNARFAVNAANARWGSLYDALYGTDAIEQIGDLAPGSDYNPVRGAAVIASARRTLDRFVPLDAGSHADAVSYAIDDHGLAVSLAEGSTARLADPDAFVGYRGDRMAPEAVVLRHLGLHLEILIDPDDSIGATDKAGIKDVVLEAAVTTIMDLEDSVAAVDAADKVLGYRNWLQLMQGTLAAEVTKAGQTFTRTMNPNRICTGPDGSTITLPGRSLLFIRQVGHLMTTDAVLDEHGREVPEGILDALVTAIGSLHDLQSATATNSRAKSMYVVKPKMHGPAEVAFAVELFERVELAFNLAPRTIKIGIMDEERRTTVNLKACIHEARDRIAFINTGFLDRTGDEIHTSRLAGPVVRKAELKDQPFIQAYERHNVDTGLATGFPGRAQIGKGMWAMPDLMADMLEQKGAQVRAGATTAWVPSPTAATLHALHYHEVDVRAIQDELARRTPSGVDTILEPPIARDTNWTAAEREQEIDNNIQSILGYVVRWIDQGIGCSKIPDIHDVALMEDRATLRISSQLLANWLIHGIITEDDVLTSMRRIAPTVDRQNATDAAYLPMGDGTGSVAFAAARDLVLLGAEQPNGYTEPILHALRRQMKENTSA